MDKANSKNKKKRWYKPVVNRLDEEALLTEGMIKSKRPIPTLLDIPSDNQAA